MPAYFMAEKLKIGYVYRGLDALREDTAAMIQQEEFIYED